MNILIDLRVLSTGWSGIAIYALNLVKGLCHEDHSHNIRLLFKDPTDMQHFLETLEEKNIPFPVSIFSLGIYNFKNFVYLKNLISSWHIDVYFTPQFFYPYIFLNCKTAVSIHDIIPLTHTPWIYKSRKAKLTWLLKYCTQKALKSSSHIFFTSKHTQDAISQVFPDQPLDNTSVLYPGIWKSDAHENAPRLIEKKYLLYVGRQDPYKNVKTLLLAFHALCAGVFPYDLVIAGLCDPRYPECLVLSQTLNLKDRVHFTGFISKSELATLYQHATVAIQPSLEEGFGLTALEPLLYNTPVLTSDIPVFRETFKNNTTLMFDPHSAQSIKDCILTYLNMDSQNKHTYLEDQKRVLSDYTPYIMAKKWLQAMESLIS